MYGNTQEKVLYMSCTFVGFFFFSTLKGNATLEGKHGITMTFPSTFSLLVASIIHTL